jgi:hypothetical protein
VGAVVILVNRPPAPFPFAVFERGAFLGASVDAAIGMQGVRGPRMIRWEDVRRLQDIEGPEGRALLFWTASGSAGLASLGKGASPDERRLLDELVVRVGEASGGRVAPGQAADDEAEADAGGPPDGAPDAPAA